MGIVAQMVWIFKAGWQAFACMNSYELENSKDLPVTDIAGPTSALHRRLIVEHSCYPQLIRDCSLLALTETFTITPCHYRKKTNHATSSPFIHQRYRVQGTEIARHRDTKTHSDLPMLTSITTDTHIPHRQISVQDSQKTVCHPNHEFDRVEYT